jgi:hypothetical protein
MRVLTRLAAAVVTVAAFTAPAAVGAAHAVTIPASTASVTYTASGFDKSAVTMKAGTTLDLTNASGAAQTFTLTRLPNTPVLTFALSSPGVRQIPVGQIEDTVLQPRVPLSPNYRLTAERTDRFVDIIAL